MTIVLAVGLALAPRLTAAAPATAPAIRAPAPDGAPPTTTDRATRVPVMVMASNIPDAPFSDLASGADPADATAAADTDSGDSGDLNGEGEGEGTESSLRALSCLEGEGGNDRDGARRGVQQRDFLKKRRFELSALGGYYASDALSSTYVYGAALSFFPSEDFGVEALVARNPVSFRLEEAFNSFDREQHFQSGSAWNFLGAMLWSPIHAKLRWNDRHITHADLLLVAGGGHTADDSVQGITFQIGAGLKLYLARFVSLRFDVRDLMVPQEVLGRGRSTHNLVIMLGFSVWVPG